MAWKPFTNLSDFISLQSFCWTGRGPISAPFWPRALEAGAIGLPWSVPWIDTLLVGIGGSDPGGKAIVDARLVIVTQVEGWKHGSTVGWQLPQECSGAAAQRKSACLACITACGGRGRTSSRRRLGPLRRMRLGLEWSLQSHSTPLNSPQPRASFRCCIGTSTMANKP
jgi:hypothetical protein